MTPDYQTSEGMAIESVSSSYEKDIKKLRKALKRIHKLSDDDTIRLIAKEALKGIDDPYRERD